MAEAEDIALVAERVSDRAGKYLTFELADEFYGLEILRVREIIGLMEITDVPRTPDYVKGVINLRGKIIPVVDLRLKFEFTAFEATRETCVVVVDIGGVQTGLIVDKVAEVMNLASENIEDAPSFGSNVDTDFILGMGKIKDHVVMLLNIGKVLSKTEMATTIENS